MIMRSPASTRRYFCRICGVGLLFGRRLLRATEAAPLTWAVLPDSRAGSKRRYRRTRKSSCYRFPSFTAMVSVTAPPSGASRWLKMGPS